MKVFKIMIGFWLCMLFVTAHSSEKNFNVVQQKELPNQLGTFREIEFNATDDLSVTLYAATLNKRYQARLHLHETTIQFLADYLDTLNKNHDFIIGINGGFYQPDFTPVGLFVNQGKKIKSAIHSSILEACVVINKQNKIIIEPSVTQCYGENNAMQTGPLLIVDGKINPNLQALENNLKSMKAFFTPHKRTLVAMSPDNQLLMITTTRLSLTDLANFLQDHADAFGVKKIKIAVNLDGGSSTGMYIRFPDEPFYYHELKHVKTFILVN